MNRLNGKTAVITGGTTGIGFETARHFIEEGARIIITGQNEKRLAAAGDRLGSNAIPVLADVRSLAALDTLASRTKETFNGVDILFANAGLGGFAPVDHIDEEFYNRQFDVNVKGVFFTVQKLAGLLNSKASVILNASAVNAKGMAGGSVYFATKAAVRSLARSLAAEFGARGIRVNALSPGLIPTDFQGKTGLPKEEMDAFIESIEQTLPLGRPGMVTEIANAAVFLASDESSYMTAADLVVDGGFMNV